MVLAYVVDILIIVIGLVFLGNLLIQVVSFIRLIEFLNFRLPARVVIYLCMLVLSMSYMFEVTALLSYSWGLPAFTMTKLTFDFEKRKWVNHISRCIIDYKVDKTVRFDHWFHAIKVAIYVLDV